MDIYVPTHTPKDPCGGDSGLAAVGDSLRRLDVARELRETLARGDSSFLGFCGSWGCHPEGLNDYDSTVAGIRHMEDAVKDAATISYPPGKEFLYLQIGWTDEAIWSALANAKQPQVFRYQYKIKQAFDPNDVGDRMYPTLPDGR